MPSKFQVKLPSELNSDRLISYELFKDSQKNLTQTLIESANKNFQSDTAIWLKFEILRNFKESKESFVIFK